MITLYICFAPLDIKRRTIVTHRFETDQLSATTYNLFASQTRFIQSQILLLERTISCTITYNNTTESYPSHYAGMFIIDMLW
jgi:hypothetical protein